MSLNYQLPEATLPYLVADDQWDYTEVFIFRLMAIGQNEVTEGTIQEIYVRNKLFQKLFGGVDFTMAQTRMFLGLTTNVTNETSLSWRKRITEQFMVEKLNGISKEAEYVHTGFECGAI